MVYLYLFGIPVVGFVPNCWLDLLNNFICKLLTIYCEEFKSYWWVSKEVKRIIRYAKLKAYGYFYALVDNKDGE